jgi:YHYH protein
MKNIKYIVFMILLSSFILEATDIVNRNSSCSSYANDTTSNFKDSEISIYANSSSCIFKTKQSRRGNKNFIITTKPKFATLITKLSLHNYDTIMLNGTKIDLLADGCYGVADERRGCFDINRPWRLNQMSPINSFGARRNNPHTLLINTMSSLLDSDAKVESSVIGFAADGFAIFGPYIKESGKVRKVKSSYRVKSGEREEINAINPGGKYNGKYRDDYEYVSGLGDLDECNGMFVNGVYSYYVTEGYPYILGCFKGRVNSSFNKRVDRNKPRYIKKSGRREDTQSREKTAYIRTQPRYEAR